MAGLDRKARFTLIAALVGLAVVVWLLVRPGSGGGGGGGGTGGSAGTAGDVATGDPAAGEGPSGRLPRRGRDEPAARMRLPGPPVPVSGVVRMAGTGAPVGGAEVAFMNPASGESTVLADDAGRYAINVASGVRWTVHARTADAVGYPETFDIGGATTRDLEVQPLATIRGMVVDSQGAPVAGAEVTIEVEPAVRALLESALSLATQSDAGGRFELQAAGRGAKVRATRGMAQGLVILGPGPADVVVRLAAPVRIRGVVVDREQAPQSGATVNALATLDVGILERKRVVTGADGAFDFELPAGWVRIEASMPNGDRAMPWKQHVGDGMRHENLRLVVGPGEILRGRVLTDDGVPVVGAKVRLVASGNFDATTGGDGYFEVNVPERAPFLVTIRHSEGIVSRQVGEWTDLEAFTLPRFGTLRVDVAGATADVKLDLDVFRPAGDVNSRPPTQKTFRGSATGVVATDLEPGHYWLTVSAPGSRAVNAEVDVPPGGQVTLSLDLAAGN